MTNTELREQVISRIQITEDQEMLEFVLGILQHNIHSDNRYELNDVQNQRINIALGQIERGDVYSEEEAEKITNEWLEK